MIVWALEGIDEPEAYFGRLDMELVRPNVVGLAEVG